MKHEVLAEGIEVYNGDCREALKLLPDGSIDCIVTSPPYFGLRDYGNTEQIGLEATPYEFVDALMVVFKEAKRVLKDEGTLWLNLGDSYAGSGKGGNPPDSPHQKQPSNAGSLTARSKRMERGSGRWGGGNLPTFDGIKAKDLIGIPWRVALALQADGWYLRQDIIWAKPNPMPESVTDRCTKAHEYIFMLSKSPKYYYDADAIKEPAIYSGLTGQDDTGFKDAKTFKGKHSDKQRGHRRWDNMSRAQQCSGMRNKRDVWTVSTKPFKEAHFATFPLDLIEPCVLSGCPEGGTVLDPFFGSGTTAVCAIKNGRKCVGIELNPDYIDISRKRIADALIQPSLFVAIPKPESQSQIQFSGAGE